MYTYIHTHTPHTQYPHALTHTHTHEHVLTATRHLVVRRFFAILARAFTGFALCASVTRVIRAVTGFSDLLPCKQPDINKLVFGCSIHLRSSLLYCISVGRAHNYFSALGYKLLSFFNANDRKAGHTYRNAFVGIDARLCGNYPFPLLVIYICRQYKIIKQRDDSHFIHTLFLLRT